MRDEVLCRRAEGREAGGFILRLGVEGDGAFAEERLNLLNLFVKVRPDDDRLRSQLVQRFFQQAQPRCADAMRPLVAVEKST